MLDVDKEFGTDTKSLWGKILDLLPTYAIFKADRESSDGDSEAKTLTAGRKDAQAALQDKITALENEIQDSVRMSHRERWINYVKWPRTRQ